jgi:hypothetical protein
MPTKVSTVAGKRPVQSFNLEMCTHKIILTLFRSFNCFFIILQKIFSVVMSPEAMLVNEHTGYGATFLAAK